MGGNQYGDTYLNAGVLNFTAIGDLGGDGTLIHFAGGILQYGNGNSDDVSPMLVGSDPVAIDTGGNNVQFASDWGPGGGSLTKYGAGSLALQTPISITGGVKVVAGTLLLQGGGDDTLSTSGSIVLAGGTLDLNGYGQHTDGVISFQGGMVTNGGVLTSNILPFDGQSGIADVILAGPAGLIKSSLGTLYLTQANTYSGGTTLTAGTLNIVGDSSLGDPTGGVTFSGNSTLQAGWPSVDLIAGRTITISGNNVTATFDTPIDPVTGVTNSMSIAALSRAVERCTRLARER